MKHLPHFLFAFLVMNSIGFSQSSPSTTSSENGPGYEMQASESGTKTKGTPKKKATETSHQKEPQKMEESPSTLSPESETEKKVKKSETNP